MALVNAAPSGGRLNAPDYYNLGLQVCVFFCLGFQYTIDRFGQSYFSANGGFGLGVGVGVTPGFIDNADPQYHTRNYVADFIDGTGSATSAGVGFVSVTRNPRQSQRGLVARLGVGAGSERRARGPQLQGGWQRDLGLHLAH